jgi:hypothetical protein
MQFVGCKPTKARRILSQMYNPPLYPLQGGELQTVAIVQLTILNVLDCTVRLSLLEEG